jgi:hypothetical protein
MTSDTEEAGGIGGKKLAIGAVLAVGVVLLARALRGGDEDDTAADTTADTTAPDTGSAADEGGDATDALPVDTDVEGRFDEIDIVDAVYILVAGLKAAREEYQQRTDDGGA